MKTFAIFHEKRISNPLRKERIKGTYDALPPHPNDLRGKNDKGYKKVMTYNGFDVFEDELVDINLSPKTRAYNDIKIAIRALTHKMRDVIPIKKAKIIITDTTRHRLKPDPGTGDEAAGFYYDRSIYIDQYSVNDPEILIHEYAHFVADLFSTQTIKLLDEAYKELLDIYYKKAKVKRVKLSPDNYKDPEEVAYKNKIRQRISKKIGFPEYGLMDAGEFFAVLIQRWKQLPNNKATYKFKQLAKAVITRL